MQRISPPKIKDIGIICLRCEDGKRLVCSYPCIEFMFTGHYHYCPDCKNKVEISPMEVNPESYMKSPSKGV